MSSTSIEPEPKSAKKEKVQPADVFIPPPKPKLSKAERRAMQEQQRANKAARGGGGSSTSSSIKPPQDTMRHQEKSAVTENAVISKTAAATDGGPAAAAAAATAGESTIDAKQQLTAISLLSHLPPFHDISRVFSLVGPTLQLSHQVATSVSAAGAGSTSIQFTGGLALPIGTATSSATVTPSKTLHPAVLQLGYDYATLKIRGGNARCRAMLCCFRTLLLDYQFPVATPTSESSSSPANSKAVSMHQAILHDLLNPAFDFWTHYCRPHSVSMGNAFTFVKHVVTTLDQQQHLIVTNPTENSSHWIEQKQVLLENLEQYEKERMDYAGLAMADLAMPLLHQPDQVIMTFGYSEAVAVILKNLAKQQHHHDGINSNSIRVIVVDSRPYFGGKKLLKELRQVGLPCSYILVTAISYVLQSVTKVLLGASALMSDGSVLGQVGTGCVALAAHMHHIPVLVCCETYKISNKLYLDSMTYNELGDPKALNMPFYSQWSDENGNANDGEDPPSGNVKKLHLMYDLTQAEFVSGIVTELGIVPATSVAVLLREMSPQEF